MPNDVKVYAGVGHSFANDLPNQPLQRIIGFGFDAAATEDAYERVMSFFDQALTQPRVSPSMRERRD